MTARISEFDVLVPTAIWLVNQGCTDVKASIARGQGRPPEEQEAELREELLKSKGFTKLSFAPNGPDIIARDNARIWKVECKGLSDTPRETGTVRAHFYEALAQTVSYYDEPDCEEGSGLKSILRNIHRPDKPIRLVLALPRSDQYQKLLRDRIKPALRRRLDLWLLIIDPATKSVDCYDTNREI